MILKIQLLKSSFLFIALLFSQYLFAQNQFSSDELFQQARSAAFDKKDYTLAAELSKRALMISPEYADIRIFLGRVYTWWDKLDSAQNCFSEVLSKHPDNEDAAAAYADLEYWNKNPSKTLSICEEGLIFHPQSKVLMLKKAKSLIDLKRFKEANDVVTELLKNDPKNAEARSLSESVKDRAAKNKIGVSYDFVNFDKQFSDPWHIVSLDYSRSTATGSFTGRVNYANRFKTNAVQFEADAYPKISKTFYSYINAGISNKNGVFPQYRAGFSLYANLPQSFEAEAGFRYLYFSDATWIYTGSIGKYFKNYWFNFRTYITPANHSVSNSYSLTTRYYYKGTDYFGLGLGTGISPDERSNDVQLANSYQLKSYRISADYRNTFYRSNILLVRFSWLSQQYLPKETGNQYVFSLGYQRVF
jgi:YaiO family outer membrane protein